MMKYLKVADPVGMYVDPDSRLLINRGQVVAVQDKDLTTTMKRRIRAKGLLEVSEKEYLASKSGKKTIEEPKEEAPPAPEAPKDPEPSDPTPPEEPKEDQKGETKPSPRFFRKPGKKV